MIMIKFFISEIECDNEVVKDDFETKLFELDEVEEYPDFDAFLCVYLDEYFDCSVYSFDFSSEEIELQKFVQLC